ncbi:alpha/beta hydrolase [Pseudonocardia endophytica]|uniref:Alpha/beta hydrolase family protein n=1 Tax=Pseudonocardia endophytica TaxID=401976 RepID=A0A4R1HK00_PSEEN|nr:alpha/beta hydrolase [Pseudonocardia endophytica]TCK22714.1 alpha/beta hydrolase family protein [Pseudonocardia endophytica]
MNTSRYAAALTALTLLVSGLTMLVRPAGALALSPVGNDPSCASALRSRLAGPDVRVLGCDPVGRGRAVVALGDPATAPRLVVLVPGAGIDLHTLDDPVAPQHRPFAWARSLHRLDPDAAVVLWVGYPTPESVGLDAASGRLARAAAPLLAADVARLRGPHTAHVTVVGHSYGSVVVGTAASGLDADDVVLLASPGARAPHVTALGTRARVWAALAADDWIRFVPHVRLGDVGHGADPANPAFGARPLPTGGAHGHDGYLVPGSATLAAVSGIGRQSEERNRPMRSSATSSWGSAVA